MGGLSHPSRQFPRSCLCDRRPLCVLGEPRSLKNCMLFAFVVVTKHLTYKGNLRKEELTSAHPVRAQSITEGSHRFWVLQIAGHIAVTVRMKSEEVESLACSFIIFELSLQLIG